ncbi:TPA: PIN domain-containing protein [Candidatus Woesearchaeota archaeon]|nr:PIN domain-containing protein [Candidatus Woesearchaeota archaeon]
MNFMIEIEPLFAVDTNILVHAYNNNDQEKHEKATALLIPCWEGKCRLVVSSQNLGEFFRVVTEKQKNLLPSVEAQHLITQICLCSDWIKLHYDYPVLLYAIQLSLKKKKAFWDTLLAATLLSSGITHLYTENIKDFQHIPGLKVHNPFKTPSESPSNPHTGGSA